MASFRAQVMALWVKYLLHEPDDLSLIPRSQAKWKEKTNSTRLSSDLTCTACSLYVSTAPTNNKIFKWSIL